MYGPPGTGKTLLARACAAQTEATFLKLAGPQLVQMFIGDGAKLVRDCFALAKEKAPSIIFIDELDAIGTKRFDSDKSGDREVQRTMLELLNQLDGFASDDRIKVLAATNRIDVLDPALLRSGRLDRKIEFPLPNEEARAQILRIHSRKMTVDDAVNWPELARSTDEFGGAQLKAVCVEAGMIALRKGQSKIGHEHYVDAISEVQAKKKVSYALRCELFRCDPVLTCLSRTRSTSMLKQYLTTAAQALEWCICKTNGIEVRQLDTPFTFTFTKHGVLPRSRLGLVHAESLTLSTTPCHHFFVVTQGRHFTYLHCIGRLKCRPPTHTRCLSWPLYKHTHFPVPLNMPSLATSLCPVRYSLQITSQRLSQAIQARLSETHPPALH